MMISDRSCGWDCWIVSWKLAMMSNYECQGVDHLTGWDKIIVCVGGHISAICCLTPEYREYLQRRGILMKITGQKYD